MLFSQNKDKSPICPTHFFFFLRGNNISLKGEGYKQGRRNNRDPETAQEQRLQRPETEQTLKNISSMQKEKKSSKTGENHLSKHD